MALENYDTRLIRIQSRDKQSERDSNTNFTVNFGNEAQAFAQKVIGISVESVTFPNFIPTLSGNEMRANILDNMNNKKATTDLYALAEDAAHVPKYYTVADFAAALQKAMNLHVWGSETPSFVLVTAEDTAPNTVGTTISLEFLGLGSSCSVQWSRDSLLWAIGVPPPDNDQGLVTWSYGQTYTYRTNLNGPASLYLHSELLSAGRMGLDAKNPQPGHQSTFSCICPIPITMPYGFYQGLQNTQQSMLRPTIVYGPRTNLDISTIDISLRDEDQHVVDLGLGEVCVILRVWRYNN
jgi:hypothetical protein